MLAFYEFHRACERACTACIHCVACLHACMQCIRRSDAHSHTGTYTCMHTHTHIDGWTHTCIHTCQNVRAKRLSTMSPLKSFSNACHSCQSGMWLQSTCVPAYAHTYLRHIFSPLLGRAARLHITVLHRYYRVNNSYLGRRGRTRYLNNYFRPTRKSHAKRVNNSFSTTRRHKNAVFDHCTTKFVSGHANHATRTSKSTVFGNAEIQRIEKSRALDARKNIINPFFE